MPKYVYSFKSAAGTFWIRQERDKSWSLTIAGEGDLEILGYYDSPFDAADDVQMRQTGLLDWDKSVIDDAPVTLLAWTRKAVR